MQGGVIDEFADQVQSKIIGYVCSGFAFARLAIEILRGLGQFEDPLASTAEARSSC